MSGDDLKSAEKRAADAAMEKENMRVAMTATEQKAISTTYVLTSDIFQAECHRGKTRETPYLAHDSYVSGCGMGSLLRSTTKCICHKALTPFFSQQHDMRKVQAVQGRLHTSSDPRRRRADDHLLRVHELRQPLEVLLKRRCISRHPKTSLCHFHIHPWSSEGATRRDGHSRHSGAKRVSGSLRSNICNSSMVGRCGVSYSSFPHHPQLLCLHAQWSGLKVWVVIRGNRAEQGKVAGRVGIVEY
jgi:hypothetical protein